eukprot:TRINITY_DN11981_c0_g1_i3.p1 TRINITY_DN11981_c0_g1~~TRINITY_DN11981_c0_g1_i3.p1  ORF type:complete len:294 (+),score=64.77 TRINITY_DN11981_c0_g1_i3:121-1002(+)
MPDRRRPPWFDFVAGGVAGCAAKTVTAPLQRLVILQQLGQVDGFVGGVRLVLRNQGVLSLWRGNLTSVLHRFPYSATSFLVYERAKHALIRRGSRAGPPGSEPVATLGQRAAAGATSGIVAVTCVYPLDLARTLLAAGTGHEAERPTIPKVLGRVLRTEGIRGLWRGVTVSAVQKVPDTALNLCVYETVRERIIAHTDLPAFVRVCVSAATATVSSLALYPFDVLRRTMQVRQVGEGGEGALRSLRSLVRSHGLGVLWRGGTTEVCRVFPFVVTMWGSIEAMRALGDGVLAPA